MKAGDYIRLTKVSDLTGDPHSANHPVGYWARGVLIRDIVIGRQLMAGIIQYSPLLPDQPAKEGAKIMVTSSVIAYEGDMVTTHNSVWRIEVDTEGEPVEDASS